MRLTTFVCATAAMTLAACETISEYTPSVRVLTPSEEPAPPVARQMVIKDPVLTADGMEIGVMFDGYAIAVFGVAPTTGWYQPELRARNGGAPTAEGVMEYDFFAADPARNDGVAGVAGTAEDRRVRADVFIDRATANSVRAIRIFGTAGVYERMIGG